ncbi:hypothetical protein J9303_07620, partial [Bacillaceae bacterium Marseille-Q3522]|nr:hypothetical protein [Bacillaceae bacterium Marseille-Q3522]
DKDNLMNTTIRNSLISFYSKYDELIKSELNFEQTYIELTHYKLSEIRKMSPIFFHNFMSQFANDNNFFDQESQKLSDELVLGLFAKGRREGKINPAYNNEVLLMLMHIFTEGMKSQALDENALLKYADQITRIFLNGLR